MRQKIDIQEFHECTGQHSHSYPQILVPLRQVMSIRAGEDEYSVTCQELCFIPAGVVHQCGCRGRLLALNLNFVDNRDAALLSRPVIISMQGQMAQLVELIRAELKQDPESKAVKYLYSYLYSKLLENCAAPSIRYISEHYDLPITVDQLARIERYNVTYYSNWFKQQTGCSPNLYLRRLRIDRAKELLTETGFTVMEIAVMGGYSSNTTFTRAFHSTTGMTPKEYRDCHCFKRKLG